MIDLALLKHWMMSRVTMQRDELREMVGSSKAFLYCSLSVDRCALFSCCCPAQFFPLAPLPWVCSPSCLWLCLGKASQSLSVWAFACLQLHPGTCLYSSLLGKYWVFALIWRDQAGIEQRRGVEASLCLLLAQPNPAVSTGQSVLLQPVIAFLSVETMPMKGLQLFQRVINILHFTGWRRGLKRQNCPRVMHQYQAGMRIRGFSFQSS